MTNFHKTFLSILLAIAACLPATATEPRPLVVAHRGLLRHAPENTLANFRACLELRLGFEFDVERTKDGHLVCIHDDTVHRANKPNGTAVIILPGGGFSKVVPYKEGTEAAHWLRTQRLIGD